jgi:hypothetical protein
MVCYPTVIEFRLVLLHVPRELTLRVVSLAVLPAEPHVMSDTQRLSRGGPPLGDSLFFR